MAFYTTRFSTSDMLLKTALFDAFARHVSTIKSMTIYQDTASADLLISWELSEFDPYFVHEDF